MFAQDEINQIVETLENGQLIVYPTASIWGIGCDALNKEAFEAVNILKKRPLDKKFVLLVDSVEALWNYLNYIPPKAINLIEYFERPLTIIYDNTKNLPSYLLADDGTVAIRVTQDPFCKEFISRFGRPVVSTSANISGEPYPESYEEIDSRILEGVAYIAEYRRTEKAKEVKPSMIVRITEDNEMEFLRK